MFKISEKYKATIHNFFFQSSNTLLLIVTGVILVPYYFNFFSVEYYGVWLAVANLYTIFSIIESGVSVLTTQKISESISVKNKNNYKKLLSSNFFIGLIVGLFFLLIGLSGFLLIRFIEINSALSNQIFLLYVIGLVGAFFSVMNGIYGVYPQVWQKTKSVGIFLLISNICSIISIIIFLNFEFGILSLCLGYFIKHFSFFILQSSWISKQWTYRKLGTPIFEKQNIIEILKLCKAPLLSKVSNTITNNSHNIIIAIFISPSITAIYDFTSKLFKILVSFLNTLNGSSFAYISLSYFESKKKFKKEFYIFSSLHISILFLLTIISFIYTEYFVTIWVGPQNYGGNILLSLLIIAIFFQSLKSFLSNILNSIGQINFASYLEIIGSLIYLITLVILIQSLEDKVNSLPISLFISSLVLSVIYIYKLRLFVNRNATFIMFFFNIIAVCLFYFFSLLLDSLINQYGFIFLGIKILLSSLIFLIIFLLFQKLYLNDYK